jgi:hypothetical protein
MTFRPFALLLCALLAAGCAATPPGAMRGPEVTSGDMRETVATSGLAEQTKIAALTRAIAGLGPQVDPEEAARAARIAVEYPRFTLAPAYKIVDPPLIHNMKVNMGYKPRGLCREWADDMEARLKQENFRTLSLHRAIANADNIRLEHSTVIVSAAGAPMQDGIVLDPWREGGGKLYWARVPRDDEYEWVERAIVFEWKRNRRAGAGRS